MKLTVEELISMIQRGDKPGLAKVFSEMKMAIADRDAMLVRVRDERDRAVKTLQELQRLMPKLRATLARMKRDHGINFG